MDSKHLSDLRSDRQKFEEAKASYLGTITVTLKRLDEMQEEITSLKKATIYLALRNHVKASEISTITGLTQGRISQIKKKKKGNGRSDET